MLALAAALFAPATLASAPTTGAYSLLDAPERRLLSDEFRPRIAEPRPDDPAIPNHPALTDTFFLGLGFFSASSNTEARLDSSSGVGTTLDLEDVMGLDSNDVVPQGLARWRMSERWRL